MIGLTTPPHHNVYIHYLVINRQPLLFVVSVSQGSVATYARYDLIFNNDFTATLLRNLPVKDFRKSVKIRQNYGHEFVASLFRPTLFITANRVSLHVASV